MTNVPAGAGRLLAFLRSVETGREGYDAYRTIIGHHEDELAKPITSMTLDELQAAQLAWGRKWGSSAAGAYQILRKTLRDLMDQLGLRGSEKFTPDLQDRFGFQLLVNRGWHRAVSGRLSRGAFALAIAKEWASMPVLEPVKGQKRKVRRGESYYAGDGLNKSLVDADEFEAVLDGALELAGDEPAGLDGNEILRRGQMNHPLVRKVQEELRRLGYAEVGNPDGDFGGDTEKAILSFRHDNKLPLEPVIDNELLAALPKAERRVLSDERVEATPEAVREKVPEVKATWWTKIAAFWGMVVTAVTTLVGWVAENVDQARNFVRPVVELLGDVPWYVYAGIVLFGLLAVWRMNDAREKADVAAYRSGERR